MTFTYDIYISYSLNDNNQSESSSGWVSNFKNFLTILLVQILGEEPLFLNYASQERPSSTELAKTGIFISILSPKYVQNEACVEEINDFANNIDKSTYFNEYERIFKVIKFPVEGQNQPSKLQNLLNYELYDNNIQSGEASEITDFFKLDAERTYWLKLIDIAYQIAAQIKKFRNLSLVTRSNNYYNSKTVYLAEAGMDLKVYRDNIKRELLRYGFNVLPNQSLPSNEREMELSIRSDLEKSRLSIHLIGDYYGEKNINSEKSILDIQNHLASEHSGMNNAMGIVENKFNRLIWISPSAQLHNDSQKIFVDNLRRELEENEGAEILQSPIEDFKTLVLQELLGLNENKFKNSFPSNNKVIANKCYYLIFDAIDEYECKKIEETLKANNIELLLPSYEGNLLTLREKHLHNLRICDGAIIYVNNVNELWVKMKYLDLLKAPGLGRTKNEMKKSLVYGKSAKNRFDSFVKFEIDIFEQNHFNFNNSFLNFIK